MRQERSGRFRCIRENPRPDFELGCPNAGLVRRYLAIA